MGKNGQPSKGLTRRALFLRSFIAAILMGGAAMVVLLGVISLSPGTGGAGADLLRNILGPGPVADLEAVVFTVQDSLEHTLFIIRGSTPAAPWPVSGQVAQAAALLPSVISTPAQNSTATPLFILDKNALTAHDNATPTAILSPTPTFTPSPTPWQPANLPALGQVPEEGVWEPYILDGFGKPLAYRTYLAPDTDRPYAIVAVVAIDYSRTRLHYQLGTEEPVSPGRDPGTGRIPPEYLQPGILKAAFNGGFKTIHGNYGVIVAGETLVPLRDGLGTLIIYQDGSLRIVEWNAGMSYSPEMAVVRQNCPLVLSQGEITEKVYNNSINSWGGTIKGDIVTFRSGIGLSQDSLTLYYFAGNYLSTLTLAKAMQAAGAYQAMQLDINNYYVLFTAFELQNDQQVTIPLLPKQMVDNVGRFLDSYSRDFFYVTIKQ